MISSREWLPDDEAKIVKKVSVYTDDLLIIF
jgi:hypothetical protein